MPVTKCIVAILSEHSAESEDDDEQRSEDGDRGARGVAPSASGNWNERVREMERGIDDRRSQLTNERGLAEEERRRLAQELLQREGELASSKAEHERLVAKLASIEGKLIVGGENLLEKAERQAQLLDDSNTYGLRSLRVCRSLKRFANAIRG